MAGAGRPGQHPCVPPPASLPPPPQGLTARQTGEARPVNSSPLYLPNPSFPVPGQHGPAQSKTGRAPGARHSSHINTGEYRQGGFRRPIRAMRASWAEGPGRHMPRRRTT
jgi:hypothetical protein